MCAIVINFIATKMNALISPLETYMYICLTYLSEKKMLKLTMPFRNKNKNEIIKGLSSYNDKVTSYNYNSKI